ncbi:MAG: hypothetical protein FWG07_09970 [Treponema sp.]|nr:hypothetical protein [Treponema sp.]
MKIPNDVLAILESELDGMEYGHAGLDVFVRDGKPRFEVSRRRSFFEDTFANKQIIVSDKKGVEK